jgi:hypothetical protein
MVKRMALVVLIAGSIFGGHSFDCLPEWAWPVWSRSGLENIFSKVRIFGENIV